MTRRKLGIVGCGPRGRAYAAVIGSIESAELCLCIDPDLQTARACAALYRGDVSETWDAPMLDGVIVTTPHDARRANLVVAAMNSGIPVLLDPPLSFGVLEARRLVRAAARAGRRLLMAFTWRFEPIMGLIHTLLPEPMFGHMLSMSPRYKSEEWQLDQDDSRYRSWATVHHALDLLAYLFGEAPDQILVAGKTPRPGSEFGLGDSLAAELFFNEGRHAALTVAAAPGTGDLGDVVVDLSDGNTRASLWSNWSHAEIRALDGRALTVPPVPGIEIEHHNETVLIKARDSECALRASIRALVDGSDLDEMWPGSVDGLRAAILARALHSAIVSGRRQTLRGL